MTAAELVLADISDREEWLAVRRTGIGSSDSHVLMLGGHWDDESPYFVWRSKVDPEFEIEVNQAMRRGVALEDEVAAQYSHLTGNAVETTGIWRSHAAPVLLASPDRLIPAENGGLECKTSTSRSARYFDDDTCPQRYEWQARHCMAVLQTEWWDVACLVVDTWELKTWRVHRDVEKEAALIAVCEEFWANYVEPGVAPEPDHPSGLEISYRFDTPSDEVLNLEPDDPDADLLRLTIADRNALKKQAKAIGEELDVIDDRLRMLAGDHQEVQIAGEKVYTWKQYESRRFDSKKYQAAHPKQWRRFSKLSKYRSLNVSKKFDPNE